MTFNEPLQESWRLRYGKAPSDQIIALEKFLTHRSVRRFSESPVTEAVISTLVAAAQSAATSSNLQSWSVISVEDRESRAIIAAACGGQKQILTAPWFFVFLADLHRVSQSVESREVGEVAISAVDTAEMYTVAAIDAALASERMVCAAESVGLGTCYIGAIRNRPAVIRDLLELPTHTFALFGLCLGYPSAQTNADIKPRLGQQEVWFREKYPAVISAEDYNARMAEFYDGQGQDSSRTWAQKSSERVSVAGLAGRESLLEWIQQQGLLLR